MADTNTTPAKKPAAKKKAPAPSAKKNGAEKKRSHPHRSPSKETEPTTLAKLIKQEPSEEHLIPQVASYLYNRWCGAHQNSAAEPSGMDLVRLAREKFGAKAMSASSGGGANG